jgi:hypothetical protein
MPSSLLKYHRNNIPHSDDSGDSDANSRNITAFYSYGGSGATSRRHSANASGYATAYTGAYSPANSSYYVLFVASSKNIYIETQSVSIVIPYTDLPKYNKLYVYYIISLQLTPTSNSKVYYSDIGYKGVYKEKRYWYILSNICWKSSHLSFGDYCYFKENPLNINLSVCDTYVKIDDFLDLFNNRNYEDPYKICDWLINHEINVINRELYQNEQIVNDEKMLYERLQIVKRHFAINEDIVLKIYDYIVYDTKNKIMI